MGELAFNPSMKPSGILRIPLDLRTCFRDKRACFTSMMMTRVEKRYLKSNPGPEQPGPGRRCPSMAEISTERPYPKTPDVRFTSPK